MTNDTANQKVERPHYSVVATSFAATGESFYRSALNAMLNRRLTHTHTPLFPRMHIQIPTRVVYINGFKGIRGWLDDHVRPKEYSNPSLVQALKICAPGIIMTPVSGLLEAQNATQNPEPNWRKAFRGFDARCAREVAFGIGLNQMSDYCAQFFPCDHPQLQNALGSMMAGVISGYVSHVPHNLSTMKLIDPSKGYRQHFDRFSHMSDARVPAWVTGSSMRRFTAVTLAVLFPRGVVIRTTQIVGSFILLNGTIFYLQHHFGKMP